MTEQPSLDALTQQRDREDLAYMRRLLTQRTAALNRVITERDGLRDAVLAIADRLDEQAGPYLGGSMFFDDAPTTRLRARASVRRDIATEIRAQLQRTTDTRETI